MVVLPDASLAAGLKQGPAPGALYAYVGAAGAVEGSPEAIAAEEALVAARESGLYALVISGAEAAADHISAARAALCAHVPAVIPPPYRPLVVAGPFGTGKRMLLQVRLFISY